MAQRGYTLRFPFRLAPGQEFSKLDEPYLAEHSGLGLKLGEQSGLYFLSIGEFPSEEAGRSFIPKLWAGLMWAVLHQGLSPDASLSPQEIKYHDDPLQAAKNVSRSLGLGIEKLDGILDGSRPAIYPTDKVVRVLTGQPISLLLGFPPDKTVALITEVVDLPFPERVLENRKLKVALDLYNSFFRETSANARFLTLNMALEALAPSEPKHQCAVDAIDRWVEELKTLQASLDSRGDEWAAYDSLIREIGFRKEKSIRSSIRTLVCSVLQSSEPDADELATQAVRLYDMRSRLVHDGHVEGGDLGRAITDLRGIAFSVLRARFIQVATAGE